MALSTRRCLAGLLLLASATFIGYQFRGAYFGGSPKRVTVIKFVSGYGDYDDKDIPLLTRICRDRIKGSLSSDDFEGRYGKKSATLVSPAVIEFDVQTQIDERRTIAEDYVVSQPIATYVDGVAMNDGESLSVRKRRDVLKGKIRHVFGRCTAFEYQF